MYVDPCFNIGHDGLTTFPVRSLVWNENVGHNGPSYSNAGMKTPLLLALALISLVYAAAC
jgi:hypothetical protein